MMADGSASARLGVIASVRGSVVDVRFDGLLPPIHSVLRTGTTRQVVIEVLAQPDAQHVRGIALIPTLGLAACFRQLEAAPTDRGASGPRSTGSKGAVVFGSDQGLVGRFNEVVADEAIRGLAELSGSPRLWAVGERVHARLTAAGLTPTLFAVPSAVEGIATLVAQILVATNEPVEAAELWLFHNRPTSTAGYEPVRQRLLPLDDAWRRELAERPRQSGSPPEILGSARATLRALVGEYLFISLFRACAESLASENKSRLEAMQRADENIDELLEQLGGRFHRLRQSSIDEELFDVIAGFEALSGGTHP
jgi:F-type H+-transporting ATPase subunit gamma